MTTELARLIDPLCAAAEEAGAMIDRYYQEGFAVRTKSDDSPVTDADEAAEAIILPVLKALLPDVSIVSEESGLLDGGADLTRARFWAVDPLDGTKEFLSRNGEFTVNIALIDAHVPVLGVVYAPARDVLYQGSPQGAFRTDNGSVPKRIGVVRAAASSLRIVGSRSHRGDSLDAVLQRIGEHSLLAIGSSLKLCMVAEGSADFYPRLGPTSEWDTAAAHAVVLAAGGEVTDTRGQPLRYNTKAELLNPHFLVYGDRTRNWVELVQS